MSKHTPGPWFVSGIRRREYKGTWLCILHYNQETNEDEEVARIGYDERAKEGQTSLSAANADARLIAAAPDLLEALQNAPLPSTMGTAAEHYQRFYDWWNTEARAAIAKAKGESS